MPLLEALDSFTTDGRNVVVGERVSATDPLAKQHPGLFVSADLSDAAREEARQAYWANALEVAERASGDVEPPTRRVRRGPDSPAPGFGR
jgi:hypothetical protein